MPLPRVVAAPAHRALQRLIVLPALLVLPCASAAAQSAAPDSGAGDRAAIISGTVYDSLAARPLAGALVQVVARAGSAKGWSAITDTNGGFALSGIPRGLYLVGFLHPSLDSLGLGVPVRMLDVGDSATIHLALAVPSAATIRSQLCSNPRADDSTGLVLGFIRDADSDAPLDGASMVVMWTEIVVQNGIHTNRRQVPAKSNSEGWYALCGVPSEGPVTARAEAGKDASGYIEIAAPPRGLLHRDFRIPRGSAAVAVDDTVAGPPADPVRHGTARLAGSVRDARGKPLAGAQLMVWGSGITGSTGDDGTFSLSELPAGTQALEVRYVGYAPKRVTVDLVSDQRRSVAITLDERADVLGAVTVYGKPGARRDITAFLERRKHGFGQFLTRADIEKMHPFQFTDLMRMVSGFRVTRGAGFDYSIVSTRGGSMGRNCVPQIYIDGMPLGGPTANDSAAIDPDIGTEINLLVAPSEIAGVEFYPGAGGPPQYTQGLCGSIVIWTGPDIVSKQ